MKPMQKRNKNNQKTPPLIQNKIGYRMEYFSNKKNNEQQQHFLSFAYCFITICPVGAIFFFYFDNGISLYLFFVLYTYNRKTNSYYSHSLSLTLILCVYVFYTILSLSLSSVLFTKVASPSPKRSVQMLTSFLVFPCKDPTKVAV